LPSATATDIWTETPTLTLLPSETPTLTSFPTDTATAATTADPVGATDFPPELFTLTVTDLPPEFPPTATLPAEPQWVTTFSADFETTDLSAWQLGAGWGFHPIATGQVLRVYHSTDPLTLQTGDYFDVAAAAQFVVDYGTAHLSVRQSAVGNYTATLDAAGAVSLYRAEQLVATGQATASSLDQWRTVRVSAVGGSVRVSVDGLPILAYHDPEPLPAGRVAFAAQFAPLPADYGTPYPPVNTLLVDNFQLFLPGDGLLPTPTPTSSATTTATASATATATLTATASATSTAVWVDQFTDDFETLQRRDWLTAPFSWVLRYAGSSTLALLDGAPLTLPTSPTANVRFQARFYGEVGAWRVGLQETAEWAGYAVVFKQGQVELYRAATLVQSVQIPLFFNQWHHLQVTLLEGQIEVWLNGQVQLSWLDPAPLPAGATVLAGLWDSASPRYFVDDVRVQRLDNDLPAEMGPAALSVMTAPLAPQTLHSEPACEQFGEMTKLFFAERLPENDQIYQVKSMNEDGTCITPITPPEYSIWNFAIAPNGEQIAFIGQRDGATGLYVMRIDGTDLHFILNTPVIGSDQGLDWSPDSQQIAFIAPSSPAQNLGNHYPRSLYVLQQDGSQLRELHPEVEQDIAALAWSPTANTLAFISFSTSPLALELATLHLIDSDGAHYRTLPFDDGRPENQRYGLTPIRVHWLPAGQQLLVTGDAPLPGSLGTLTHKTDIYRLAITGGLAVNLTNTPSCWYCNNIRQSEMVHALAPDGTQALINIGEQNLAGGNPNWFMDAATGSLLGQPPAGFFFNQWRNVNYSGALCAGCNDGLNAGEHLLFTDTAGILVADQTTTRVFIGYDALVDGLPLIGIGTLQLSPDAQQLAFECTLLGESQQDLCLVAIQPDWTPGVIQRYTQTVEHEFLSSWSPDSQHFVYLQLAGTDVHNFDESRQVYVGHLTQLTPTLLDLTVPWQHAVTDVLWVQEGAAQFYYYTVESYPLRTAAVDGVDYAGGIYRQAVTGGAGSGSLWQSTAVIPGYARLGEDRLNPDLLYTSEIQFTLNDYDPQWGLLYEVYTYYQGATLHERTYQIATVNATNHRVVRLSRTRQLTNAALQRYAPLYRHDGTILVSDIDAPRQPFPQPRFTGWWLANLQRFWLNIPTWFDGGAVAAMAVPDEPLLQPLNNGQGGEPEQGDSNGFGLGPVAQLSTPTPGPTSCQVQPLPNITQLQVLQIPNGSWLGYFLPPEPSTVLSKNSDDTWRYVDFVNNDSSIQGWITNTHPEFVGYFGNCDNLPFHPDYVPTATPTPTFTPTATHTPTPSPTPLPPRLDVLPEAIPLHENAEKFGLPMPFQVYPVERDPDYVWNHGYGMTGFASQRQTAYKNTQGIHTGLDFGILNSATDQPIMINVLSVCDGVIVGGRAGHDGSAGGGESLSIRCFATGDPDGDGFVNLSNVIVTYNHLSQRSYAPTSSDNFTVIPASTVIGQINRNLPGDINHLHLEVFIRGATDVADDGIQPYAFKDTTGSIRINPLLMFSKDIADIITHSIISHATHPYYPLHNTSQFVGGILVNLEEVGRASYGIKDITIIDSATGEGDISTTGISFWAAQILTPVNILEWPANNVLEVGRIKTIFGSKGTDWVALHTYLATLYPGPNYYQLILPDTDPNDRKNCSIQPSSNYPLITVECIRGTY
jgi:hypothetical protein